MLYYHIATNNRQISEYLDISKSTRRKKFKDIIIFDEINHEVIHLQYPSFNAKARHSLYDVARVDKLLNSFGKTRKDIDKKHGLRTARRLRKVYGTRSISETI